jgi:hypothetical protein
MGHRAGILAGSDARETPILLVDDVEDNLDVYTQFFLHNGWRAATAASGKDALAQAVSLTGRLDEGLRDRGSTNDGGPKGRAGRLPATQLAEL